MTRTGADTATLAPYLPRLVIEWAGNDPSATHRVVDGSLLFADISGFTALSERLARNGRVGAEELTETLSRCFGDLLAVAYDAGGSLLKFGGDALLLLFRDDGHAARACASALRMRARMADTGRVTTSVGTVRLRMSIGVHSGPVHLFRVGRSHRELIVTGPAATATVDMEGAASAGQIVVSPATAALVPRSVIGAPLGPGFLLRDRELDVAGGLATGPVGPVTGATMSVPVALREQLRCGTVESEHRNVSIAFVHFDEVDALVADEGPAALATALDELVADVQAAADEHGVTFLASDVDRDGGKVILVAGAPRALGDDEGRMLRCLHQISASARRLPVRIGVNRGHVFVGEVGPTFRRTYTVMGDAVNLAARLMAKAEPGQILATASVLDRSGTVFDTVVVAPFMVKGKSQPVQAFAVGAPAGRRVGPASDVPLLGRDKELDAVDHAVGQARHGAGGLLEIAGGAGIGKSRLVDEVLARAEGFSRVQAFCEPYEAQTPYYACRFLLRAVTGAANGSELRASVERVAPDLLPWLPLLAAVVDVDVAPTEETTALDPRYRRQRTQRVVVELLRALVVEPFVFVVEDGQWLDGLSAEMLAAIGVAAADRPWLVCVARRDDVDGPDLGDRAGERLSLGPLDDDAGRAIVSALTADAPLRPHERDALVARAGGNPLFLAELVRSRAGAGDGEPLPESLEAVVAAQIDRLPTEDRRVLRWMSVLGPIFEEALLEPATGGRVQTAAGAIRRFSPFVESAGPGLLRFSNECYRQVSYDGLPFRRRRQLHAAVGDALERATAGRERERAAALSYHFMHAQAHDRCWRHALVAAEHARATYANAEAAELYERALSVRRQVTSVSDATLAETWEALGNVALLSGNFEQARGAYRRARPLRAGDVGALAYLCTQEYSAAMHQGRNTTAVRWLRKGLRLLEGHDGTAEVSRRAELRYFYAHCRQQGGHPREALRWSQLAVDDALRSDNRPALARSYLLQDWALMALGQVEQATNAVLALPICEELGDLSKTAEVLLYLGNFAYMQGKWDEALELWTRASDAYQRTGNTVDATFGACNSAEVLVHQGRYDEAEPRLRDALEVWQSMGYAGGVADVLGNLGRLALVRGELDEAVRLFEEVRGVFAAAGDAREVGACGALAECLLRKGSIADAVKLIDGALRKEKLSGDTEFAAMLHRLRGYAHVALGRIPDAWADFDDSLAVARSRGAAYEVALTLEALSVVAELGGLAVDPSTADERAALLAQLGVQATPPPPLPLAA